MPAHKKKTTTSTSPEATSTVSSAEPLKLETFHQYLRAEIRHATRLVMEEIMCENSVAFWEPNGEKVPRSAKAIATAFTREI